MTHARKVRERAPEFTFKWDACESRHVSLQESELRELKEQVELRAKELQSHEALLQKKVSHCFSHCTLTD